MSHGIANHTELTAAPGDRAAGRRYGRRRPSPESRAISPAGRYLLVLLAGLALIGLWELISRWKPVLVAAPWDTVVQLGDWVGDGSLWPHVRATLEECLIGAALSFAVGIVVGIVLATVPWLDVATRPYIDIINTLPRMGLAPLFVLWFGLGLQAKVALVFSVLVFVVMINTHSGVKNVDPQQVLLVRFLGGGRLDIIRRVIVPSLTPWLVATFRLVTAYSLGAAVIGEFIAGNEGLGYLLNYNTQIINARGEFAALLALSIVATVLTVAVMMFEHYALRWRRLSTRTGGRDRGTVRDAL